jgi:hypothetical protein
MTTRPPKASGRLRGCLPSPDTTLCPWNRPFLRVSGRLSGIAYESGQGKTVAPARGPLLGRVSVNAPDAPDAQTGIDPAGLFGLQPQTPGLDTPDTCAPADESGPGTMRLATQVTLGERGHRDERRPAAGLL